VDFRAAGHWNYLGTAEKLGSAASHDTEFLQPRANHGLGKRGTAQAANPSILDVAKAYEHQWAMADAFEFHSRIGRKRIAERIASLNTLCKDGLARIPKVKLLTPRDPALSAGIICFEIEGQRPAETVRKLLERKVIASTSPYKVSYARLAPSLVNDEREAEAEAALRAVRQIV
jgi:selenocysteine lyase/cysteine desulfurase